MTGQHSSQHSSRPDVNAGLALFLHYCLLLLAAQLLTQWLAAVLVSPQAAVGRPRVQGGPLALLVLLLLPVARVVALVCQSQQQRQQQHQQQQPVTP